MAEHEEPVVIRDKRKVDRPAAPPNAGEPPQPAAWPTGEATAGASAEATGVPAGDETGVGRHAASEEATAEQEGVLAALQALLDERTADLQRVQAEYANYRKRADRDRLAAGEVAIGRVLAELLPVLDDIDRARAHDDLTGALKAVADHLDLIFGKLGLVTFGAVGDPFDPAVHEAITHAESDDVTEPTVTMVLRPGFQHGDRLLRAAMVGVTSPIHQPPETAPPQSASPGAGGGQDD
ncbi:MAG: nucleotide exchange factor GrpE [Actinomycetia bacterium]|nr:nucleotide exchange factor GrpE [Actinomycetes bacterium]